MKEQSNHEPQEEKIATMSYFIDSSLKEEIAELEAQLPVRVFVHTLRKDTFLGTHIVKTIVTFVVKEITSGLISGMGSDIWKRVKSVCESIRRTRRPEQERCEQLIKVQAKFGECEVSFVCEIKPEESIRKFELFVQHLPGQIELVEESFAKGIYQNLHRSSCKFVFISDGRWREIGRQRK